MIFCWLGIGGCRPAPYGLESLGDSGPERGAVGGMFSRERAPIFAELGVIGRSRLINASGVQSERRVPSTDECQCLTLRRGSVTFPRKRQM